MNPVWKRELRARWRGWRAFVLVFLYVAVLAAALLFQYAGYLQSPQQAYDIYGYPTQADPRQRLALLGHTLFVLLAWLQVVLWLLLAPILTATAITAEREKGLLEGLHLSRLHAGEIVWGKLLSSLSLMALLILITLPITATCFMMGGVSPGELALVTALQAATAICCASIGLAVSAWCRKGMAAIALAFVAMLAWSGLTMLVFANAPGSLLLEIGAKTHPLVAILEMTDSTDALRRAPWTAGTPSWIISLLFLFFFTLFNLRIAAKGTRRLLADGRRIEWEKIRRELKTPDATNLQAAHATASTPAQSTPATGAQKLQRFELGFLSRWQFSNPILGREVRACFRPRSTSLMMLIAAGVLVPLASLAYAQGFYWALTDANMRVTIGPALLVMYLLLTLMLCAVLGASGLAHERESGTWEALRLSLLSPAEILWGKLATPLMMSAVCGAAFLPVLLPCIRALEYSSDNARASGIALAPVLGSLLIIGATAWSGSLLGLLVSHFSKKPVTAICWTLGVLFVLLLVAPIFATQVGPREVRHSSELWLNQWHPVLVVLALFSRREHDSVDGQSLSAISTPAMTWPCVLALFLAGAAFYGVLLRELYTAQKTSDT